MLYRYLDIPGCMTLMVLPEEVLRSPPRENMDPRRGKLAGPRFRFRKIQYPIPLAFDAALLVDISGQVCLGKNSGRNRSFCFLCCWPAISRSSSRKGTSPRINEDARCVSYCAAMLRCGTSQKRRNVSNSLRGAQVRHKESPSCVRLPFVRPSHEE